MGILGLTGLAKDGGWWVPAPQCWAGILQRSKGKPKMNQEVSRYETSV